MNVRVSQSSLSRILRDAQRATAGKTPMEILRCLYLLAYPKPGGGDEISVEGTDLTMMVRSKVMCSATSHGAAVVDADTLVAFVSSLDKLAVIDLVSDGKALTVTAGRSTASFALMPVDDFPDTSHLEETFLCDMPASLLRTLSGSVATFVDRSAIQTHLTGVCIATKDSGVYASATNGHSSATLLDLSREVGALAIGVGAPNSVIVPARTLSTLESVLKGVDDELVVRLFVGGNRQVIHARSADVSWWSVLLDGNFPDVRRYFPKEFEEEFEVDAYLLMNAVLQTRMFKDDTNQHITIASESPDLLHITSPSLERGNATAVIPASAITRDVRFSVDAVTFNAAVSACASARIWIGVNPNRSVTIRPIDGMDLTQVLAPVVKGKRDE